MLDLRVQSCCIPESKMQLRMMVFDSLVRAMTVRFPSRSAVTVVQVQSCKFVEEDVFWMNSLGKSPPCTGKAYPQEIVRVRVGWTLDSTRIIGHF